MRTVYDWMKLFRKKIVRRYFTMDNGAMTSTRNALRRDERMNQTTVFLCNLPEDVKTLTQMPLVLLRDCKFPFGEFDFT